MKIDWVSHKESDCAREIRADSRKITLRGSETINLYNARGFPTSGAALVIGKFEITCV